MSDESERSVASDLADSLRGISDTLNVCGNDFSDILYAAARELERLDRLRLTDAEREAVWFFAAIDSNDSVLGSHAATLRALLERTK